MKERVTIHNITIFALLPFTLLMKVELQVFSIFCIISTLFLNNYKKSSLFYISTFFPLVVILLLGLTHNKINFLFEDDRYYWEQGMSLSAKNYGELFSKFLFERTLSFNNYIYWVGILMKSIGNNIIGIYLFNYTCFLIISSKMIPKNYGLKSWTEIPFELIFFIFFVFKDMLATAILFYSIILFRNNSWGGRLLIIAILALILEPLRTGYFMIPLVAYIFPNFILKLKYRLIILTVIFITLFYIIYGSELLQYIHPKVSYYTDSLLFRVNNSTGFLSQLFNGLSNSNYILAPFFIATATFIPLLSIQKGLLVFTFIRGISLYVFIKYLLDNTVIDKRYLEKCTFILILLQVLLAPGMLRHSLIILPFIYTLIYEKNNNIHRRSSILS